MIGLNPQVVEAVLADYLTAPITEPLRAILGFLEKLNDTPDSVTAEDIVALHQHGFSDEAITEAIYVCALFNIMDRFADAFDFENDTHVVKRYGARVMYHLSYRRLSLRG